MAFDNVISVNSITLNQENVSALLTLVSPLFGNNERVQGL
jgi:hypothetical protein